MNSLKHLPIDLLLHCGYSMIKMRALHKLKGFGALCVLLVLLCERGGRLSFDDLKAIAREFHCSAKFLRSFIVDYDFFAYDDTEFWCEELTEQVALTEKRKKAAETRWGKSGEESAERGKVSGIFETLSEPPAPENELQTPMQVHMHVHPENEGQKEKEKETKKEKEKVPPIPPLKEKEINKEKEKEKSAAADARARTYVCVGEGEAQAAPQTEQEEEKQEEEKPSLAQTSQGPTNVAQIMAEGYDLDKAMQELKADQLWLQSMQMATHLDTETICRRMDEFKAHCQANAICNRSIGEVIRHFNNWLRKKAYLEEQQRREEQARAAKEAPKVSASGIIDISRMDYDAPW